MENWKLVYVIIIICGVVVISDNNGVEASHEVYTDFQSLKAEKVSQQHRTGFHFQPPKHWINGRTEALINQEDPATASVVLPWAQEFLGKERCSFLSLTADNTSLNSDHFYQFLDITRNPAADPNAPMFYNGIYHLFYQYNPKGAVWGNIVWAHSVSTDLINWYPLEPAIYPTDPFDINGCWSGSATILPGNKPVILYTGIDSQNRQVQNLAVPKNLSDPYLKEWTKPHYNPLMVPEQGMNVSSFRDPTTAWLGKDDYWRLLVGNKRKNRGMVLLYRSKDFKNWRIAPHPLHSSPRIGMWECPDFFPVQLDGENGLDTSVNGNGIKHVLKVSLDATRFEYYTVGRYFEEIDHYVPDNTSADDATGLRFDYGNFYASKTFFDGWNNRRILLGWANESDTPKDDVAKGWAGIHTIPRKLWLDKSGRQLVQWPIKELESLRGHQVHMKGVKLAQGSLVKVQGITAAQADVEVIFRLPNLDKAEPFNPRWRDDPQKLCGQKGSTVRGGIGPFGLLTLATKNLEEYTPVSFRIFKGQDKHVVLMCSDATSSSLKQEVYKPSFGGFVDVDLSDGRLSLRSLIDHSVVESFGAKGKTCITSRVYPTLAIGKNVQLYAFNNGTETVRIAKLKAWSMRSPRINRK